MKKFAYLSALALGLTMVACDTYKEPTPTIPVTPGTTALEAAGVSVTPSAALVNEDGTLHELDLEGFIRMGYDIDVADVTIDPSKTNASYDNFRVEMQFSPSADFANSTEIPATYNNGTISVSPQDIEDAYLMLIGKNPASRVVYTRYALFASEIQNGTVMTDNVRLGGPDFFYGPVEMLVLPVDQGIVIEEKYYLVGTENDWSGDASALIPLNHSDKSAFDDPVFYHTFTVDEATAAGGWWWKIIPESAINAEDNTFDWDKAWGTAENGDTAMSGTLYNEDAQAGMIDAAGTYTLTVNMLDCTYEFKLTYPYLYTPGGSNGWSQDASMLLPTTDYSVYQGFLLLDGEFKLCAAPNWDDATTYGSAGDGMLALGGAGGNIAVPEAGLNFMWANISSMEYKDPIKVTSLGLIGDFNSWGEQAPMTAQDADCLIWKGEMTISAGQGWKFRGNDNWDINLGGDPADLTVGGDNITAEEDGTYEVTLYLGSLPYHCDVVKK